MTAATGSDDGLELRAYYDDRYVGGYMSAHSALEVWRVRRTLSDVPLSSGAILDYGCGAGAWLDELSTAFPGARVVGADISPVALASARRRSPVVPLVAFGGDRVPLADASFDLVFSYHVLEHVHNLDAAIADMVRLTRPGGYICACLPCADRGSISERVARHVDGGMERSATGEPRFFFEDPGHLRSVRSAELVARFKRSGASVQVANFSRLMAEIEYLARRPHRVTELLGTRRPTGRAAAVAIAATRGGLRALSKVAAVRDASAAQLIRDIRTHSGRRRVRAAMALAAWPVSTALGQGVFDMLPRLEWRYRRAKPAGAGQFVLLQKQGMTDASSH